MVLALYAFEVNPRCKSGHIQLLEAIIEFADRFSPLDDILVIHCDFDGFYVKREDFRGIKYILKL